ncbi:hypothetical protein PTQ19_11120 [Microbacterium esteraromaticum]|uniref:alpha/beta hydrolase family protein n=1 Tax=Microbacterium esteraromaticum TaxID=57043 RepID=UPI002367C7CF|nr:hypothetical protein [Microbacterium esteraromaticum]WDH78072.1 hypothetical protein PTQ19_11120 [Microbacterium esteraromaticum]
MRFGTGTALVKDPRFSWWSAVPESPCGAVAVLIHGSDRDPVGMRREFLDWAERTGTALLAPLFPAGVPDAGDANGYKQLRSGDTHFDDVLQWTLDAFIERELLDVDRLELFGFSGGAQFAHRLALVHPSDWSAAAFAAPGNVTLLGSEHAWWPGVGDFATVFGRERDHARLQALPVHVLVGADDDGSGVIHVGEHEPRWRAGANDAGSTRVDRARHLAQNWHEHGVPATFEIVAGAAHDLAPLAPQAQAFFDRVRRADDFSDAREGN